MQNFTFFTNIFFTNIFFNVDISINVEHKPFNLFKVILDIIMDLGLSFNFM